MSIQDLEAKMQLLLQIAQDAETLAAIENMLEALPLAEGWTEEELTTYIDEVAEIEAELMPLAV